MFFSPFLMIYAFLLFIVLAGAFVLLEIGAIHYAFGALGLPPELAFLALFASLLGSYLNIPIATIDGGGVHEADYVQYFGIRYRIPRQYAARSTTVAVNIGGAIVPIAISIYVLVHQVVTVVPSAFGVAVVAVVVHRWARPLRGLGIGVPMFIPPIVAALCAWIFAWSFGALNHIDAIAYVSGVLGTLIGADLVNLPKLRELGAPVASIGGAGTFDGIFLTGIVAVLLA